MRGFVLRLITPRPDFPTTMSEAERATMVEHGGYWSALAAEGKVLAFGPVQDAARPYGIAIVLAEDLTSVERLRDQDPALRSPHGFSCEIAPMLSLVTPEGRFDAP